MAETRRTTLVFPKNLDKNITVEAVKSDMTKGEFILRALEHYLKTVRKVKDPHADPFKGG